MYVVLVWMACTVLGIGVGDTGLDCLDCLYCLHGERRLLIVAVVEQ